MKKSPLDLVGSADLLSQSPNNNRNFFFRAEGCSIFMPSGPKGLNQTRAKRTMSHLTSDAIFKWQRPLYRFLANIHSEPMALAHGFANWLEEKFCHTQSDLRTKSQRPDYNLRHKVFCIGPILVADTQLYWRLCPSIGPSVHSSVR